MKKIFILGCIIAIGTGCASGVKKQFTLIVQPPDAQITVIPSNDEPGQQYSSPADITVYVPEDPAQAARSRVEIKREAYKPVTISLSSIAGETLKIKMEKMNRYRFKHRLLRPAPSDELHFRDKILDIRFVPEERRFRIRIQNLTGRPLKLRWQQSEYTDFMNRQRRIVHAGVLPQNRNSAIPAQEIPANGTLEQTFVPLDSFFYSQETKSYETKILFPADSENAPALKGMTYSIFLPIEIDRAIIPDYNFTFQIVDVVKE